MVDWEDVLAPCPFDVVPIIAFKAKASEDVKDRVINVLRRHYIPFILLGDVLVSCRFAIIFERTTRYTNEGTTDIRHVIVHIDPPSDRVREAIEFIFNILREAGIEPSITVDKAVEEYNRVIKALTCTC